MQSATEPRECLERLAEELVEAHGLEACSIIALRPSSEARQAAVLIARAGSDNRDFEGAVRWLLKMERQAERGRVRAVDLNPEAQRHILDPDGVVVAIPLWGRAQLLGALVLRGSRALSRGPENREFISFYAALAGVLLDQARYRVEARTSQAARLEQLETLVESGQTISSTLNVEQVCSSILSLVRRLLLARGGFIMLYDSEQGRLQVTSYSGLGKEQLSAISLPIDRSVAGRVFSTREPWIVDDVQKEALFAKPEIAARLGLHAMLTVPLLVRSEAIGVLSVFLPGEPPEGEDRIALLELAVIFAGQAAAAIQNARLFQQLEQSYDRERRIAETFQEALLSEFRGALPGVEVGCVYRAALDESVVGGDFFDVFALPDGRVALSIGDVSGKGLSAAVQTARVKFGMRGLAYDDPSPDRILTRMHRSLLYQGGYEGFVSLFFAVYDPRERRLEYANAGHEAPLLHRSSGEVEWLERTATVIGLEIPRSLECDLDVRSIQDGDHLVLYTDGLTEARCGKNFLGRSGLFDSWQRVRAAAPQEAARLLLEDVQRYANGRLRDDAAVVIVRFREDP